MLSFVEKVFNCNLESSQRDKANKHPNQVSINSRLQTGLPLHTYEAGYDSLSDAVLSNASGPVFL